MPVTTDELVDKASGAKKASVVLAQASTDLKNRALTAIANAIRLREKRDPRGQRAGRARTRRRGSKSIVCD